MLFLALLPVVDALKARACFNMTAMEIPVELIIGRDGRASDLECSPASVDRLERAIGHSENGIGVIAYSPMKSGLLTGTMTKERFANLPPDDFRKRAVAFQEPNLSRNLEIVDTLREIGNRHGRSPGEVAIAWTLRRPEVTAAIAGMRSPEQVDGVIGALEFRLSESEIGEIESHRNSRVLA